jgi:hypothetical protein
MSDLNLNSQEIIDCDLFLSLYLVGDVDVNDGEALDSLLAIFEVLGIII